jgi:hypothetical protein
MPPEDDLETGLKRVRINSIDDRWIFQNMYITWGEGTH